MSASNSHTELIQKFSVIPSDTCSFVVPDVGKLMDIFPRRLFYLRYAIAKKKSIACFKLALVIQHCSVFNFLPIFFPSPYTSDQYPDLKETSTSGNFPRMDLISSQWFENFSLTFQKGLVSLILITINTILSLSEYIHNS